MPPVTLQLPDPASAPNYRGYLAGDCHFDVRDVAGHRWVSVEPGEGGGGVYNYFEAHRICDAATRLTDATWQPLRDHPAWEDPSTDRRQRLLEAAAELGRRGTPEATLEAIQGGLGGAVNDAPEFLSQNLPAVFDAFPDGSLWLISVDHRLVARMAFLRSRYALELTPDMPLNQAAWVGLQALDGHSISGGTTFHRLFNPLLLVFSPAAIGYAFGWAPHMLVLMFGMPAELREQLPSSLASVYEPHTDIAAGDHPWVNPDFWDQLNPADLESLLGWWTQRLNVLYSHAADPTRFERLGRHDAGGQFAWFLTLERLIADSTFILSGPQAPHLVRLQAGFDLLDKAEAFLGYGIRGSGDGFKRLLRRSEMTTRLDAAWERLPVRLRGRFRSHSQALFDHVYEHIRDHAVGYRLTPRAVRVWRPASRRLVARPMDNYVPDLVRATRNSAHGFLELVRGDDRHLIATHDGHMPSALSDLAALILFGVFADAEQLVAGNWF